MSHRDYVWMDMVQQIAKYNLEGKMLDIGCKNTAFKNLFEHFGIEWHGVDKIPNSKEVTGGVMEDLPYKDSSFDILFACHSFEHCERPIDALREFKRVLKPGGYMFIYTPNPVEKQITRGDQDHIFCLNVMQMTKLIKYCLFDYLDVYKQIKDIKQEQDYNIVTIGRKPL